jgi:methylmalonyl-CoA mutase C-terminal domain/subunit
MDDKRPIRVLIAKVGCDIHERGALTLMTTLRDIGMEVIYTGRYQTPQGVANAAISEDVDVMDIPIISGGLLAPEDIKALEAMGVTGNYGPGTPIDLIIKHIKSLVV